MPVIAAIRKRIQEVLKFKARLDYRTRPCLSQGGKKNVKLLGFIDDIIYINKTPKPLQNKPFKTNRHVQQRFRIQKSYKTQ
jgi:hypothetical protein